ncbi:tRNA (guanosine(37)-N1)-methyltransferase TrmD [Suicoccus acidiformans]|uniref:tRNA (guanine-N(1)-)-methyltransferase n=1 Tax=Suicoccus acidiformans TaxID=2036206 RepID=A0A347WKU0_9LACT|nr:tRNA (guanosine(37)-N1)-methyltransferase TrmD [Suicoccus acidiformans]AXY25697.1 tRNA (guanosine(37)-N1)-methyltransferase TrmD [Suicoccus acidiformans]
MKIDVLTLFPEMFEPMHHSMMKQAQESGQLDLTLHNFRDYAVNKHGHVDDYPYGGGAGMLLRVEPIVQALEAIDQADAPRIILLDPAGQKFTQETAAEWSQEAHLIFVCGHYEGFDERVRHYVTDEVSLGDYVLTNGELATMVMIDATVRLLPEVLGNDEGTVQESHQRSLLEYPQYTRPREFRGMEVPETLLSGHHERIAAWQRKEAIRRTYLRRPDLLQQAELTPEEAQDLVEVQREEGAE